jgi:ketosteroid isomerase-like protein
VVEAVVSRLLLRSLVPLALVAACTLEEQDSGDSSPEAAEVTAIRTARLEQNAAIRAGDIDGAAMYWSADLVVLAGLGAHITGIEQAKARLASDPRVFYERVTGDIQLSASWTQAWETGTWTGHDRTAADSTLISGRYAARWVRGADGWRIHSELFVADQCQRDACAWPLVAK